MNKDQNTWESQKTAGHETHGQSVVYDSENGKDVALVYDGKEHAQLIASAPELLEACIQAEKVLRWAAQESQGRVKSEIVGGWLHHADEIRGSINKATETE